jgi:hypothetical protein
MTALAALLKTSPPERLEALHQRFSRGGDWDELIVVAAGFVALFALLVVFCSLQRRRQRTDSDCPRKLYRRLVQQLGLSAPQRRLLHRMAADLELPNPTTLLLSPGVFKTHAKQWLRAVPKNRPEANLRIKELADALFTVGVESA